jgi:hypothetical protein
MTLRPYLVTGALLFITGTGFAESHPAWWRYASPEATALVGMQWEHLRVSPFAAAISGELSGDRGLGFPDLDCIRQARQTLISSPALLAMAAGDFPAEALREQAVTKGLKRTVYHETEIWVTPGKGTLSIARISDQLVLLGYLPTLKDAIDRSLMDEASRQYSSLLARAARYAQDDLFVVAASLPDPLAGLFVPIEAEAEGFEGGISLQGGLRLAAALTASSDEAAVQLAKTLQQMVASLPPAARGIEIAIDQKSVTLSLAVSEHEFDAGLKGSAPAVTPAGTNAAPQPETAVPKPAGPQIIRIYGLDGGTREIVMRPGGG